MAGKKSLDRDALQQSHERTMLDEFFDQNVGDCTGQTFMFEVDDCPATSPPLERDAPVTLNDGTKLTERKLKKYARSLLAKYLAVAHGLSIVTTARVLGCSVGEASRLVQFRLPITANLLRPRAHAEIVVHELGMSEVSSPDALPGSTLKPRTEEE